MEMETIDGQGIEALLGSVEKKEDETKEEEKGPSDLVLPAKIALPERSEW